MAAFTIEPLDMARHRDFVMRSFLIYPGSHRVVTRGKLHDLTTHQGFVAVHDGEPAGLLTYTIDGVECEITVLHSLIKGIGIGARLIDAAKDTAKQAGCKRLWLITTNDNTKALRFYQRRGFTLAAVYINIMKEYRKIKPEIPPTGDDDIPQCDEIELEMWLK